MATASVGTDSVDFAIIAALQIERDAVLTRLDAGYELVQEDSEPLTFLLWTYHDSIFGRAIHRRRRDASRDGE